MTAALQFPSADVSAVSKAPEGELTIMGVFLEDGKPVLSAALQAFDANTDGRFQAFFDCGAFDAKAGTTTFLGTSANFPAGLAVVGMGDKTAYSPEVFAECVEKAVKAFSWAPRQVFLAADFLSDNLASERAARLFAATAKNALTPRATMKTKTPDAPKTHSVAWLTDDLSDSILAAFNEGSVTADAMAVSRHLADLPGNHCTPAYLAEAVTNAATDIDNLEIMVFDEVKIRELGMGAFLSVAQGSVVPPRFIVMRYQGTTNDSEPVAPIALVGKGITFDAGGISLKPAANMADMTYDMSGAAVVIGTVIAAARAKLPLNLLGVVAACENLPSGSAAKPGDIVTSLSGKTIEILNTDCEGRMILADALTWTARQKPALMIDAATLTGACCIALGAPYTGLFTPDDDLAHQLTQAGIDALDEVWRLPVGSKYEKLMRTPAADIANQATVRDGGASSAAAFLSVFTEGVRWAHLDIAATANASGRDRASTGRPVPMLMRFLMTQAH